MNQDQGWEAFCGVRPGESGTGVSVPRMRSEFIATVALLVASVLLASCSGSTSEDAATEDAASEDPGVLLQGRHGGQVATHRFRWGACL